MNFDINDLNIIYEDNHIIVVVKPVGIPVQQDKSGDIDMLTIIKKYIKIPNRCITGIFLLLARKN